MYLRRAFLLLIVVASLYSTVFDPWDIDGGYSFLWLAVLYLLGAIMKKCGIGQTIPSGMLLLGIVLCTAVSWGIKLYEDQFGRFISVCVWQSYSSPSYLLSAMLHVLLFSRMRFSQWQKNCIRFAAPGAFAVYILNCHSYIWKHMLSGKFSQYASQGIGTMVFHVIAFSVAFVVAGIVIDYLRRKVFVFLHIDQLAKWLVALCTKVLDIVMIPKVKIK